MFFGLHSLQTDDRKPTTVLNDTQLHDFWAVARAGSIARAADWQ
jgi:hypothetical protein